MCNCLYILYVLLCQIFATFWVKFWVNHIDFLQVTRIFKWICYKIIKWIFLTTFNNKKYIMPQKLILLLLIYSVTSTSCFITRLHTHVLLSHNEIWQLSVHPAKFNSHSNFLLIERNFFKQSLHISKKNDANLKKWQSLR